MIWISTETVTNAYIDLIKAFFNSDYVTQDYRWNKELKETSIQVLNHFAQVERKHPQIVVRAGYLKNTPESLGSKTGEGVEDGETYISYGGAVDMSVSVTVRARSTLEHDRIVDLLFVGLIWPLKNALRAGSIEIYPPFIEDGGHGEEPIETENGFDKVYYQTFIQKIKGYWREYVSLKNIESLEKILCTRILGTSTTNGPDVVGS